MPVRVPELTIRIDHPPQSWLRHGGHANYLNGMTSWRLAVTPALGRNTGLAILKDAGIQCGHGTTFQRAWPPQGSTHHHQRWCPQAVGAP
jgi:hypothetical protein